MVVKKETVIEGVKMLAAEKGGKAPTSAEFDADWRTVSAVTARNKFGSWNNCLKAAGLEVNLVRKKVKKEEMISQVQRLAQELGRRPTMMEFNNDPDTVSATSIIHAFGKWSSFLEAAGLGKNQEE